MADLAAVPAGYRPNAGIALFNATGQLFLARRKGFTIEHGWQMPQGGIDAGEDPLVGALRELEEEISVPASAVTLRGRIDRWITYDFDAEAIKRGKMARKFKGQAQLWFAFELTGADSLINLDTAEPEFSEWIWTDFDTAVDRIVDFKKDVYSQVAAEFGSLQFPA